MVDYDTLDSNELSDIDVDADEELDLHDTEASDDQQDDDQDNKVDYHDADPDVEDPDAEEYDDLPSDPSRESEDSDWPPVVAPSRTSRPKRETKRRQLTLYEEDDLLDSEPETSAAKKKPLTLRIPKRTSARLHPLRDPDDFSESELTYRPNPSKLTERQRAKLEEDPNERYEDSIYVRMDQQLLALNRKTTKRIETEEQMALRRAENARKRAHYKVKQLEVAKRNTLNKLLNRRATKPREVEKSQVPDEPQALKPRRPVVGHPALLRWVSLPEGLLLAASEAIFFERP
ncbi:hypothetical protein METBISCDRAFT_25531 [Metschnikowia bicuspidata]|uniref:INO80 complex subunit B-like conserved region domain-containing protein n=1 Tax=Metschnikowia bicuspidata TaxID=27322 RepID=A0A4P9ZKC8_9ASCO|nr:hypothetical protein METBISCDRAFT_25531 [Metschnikowia bicuspidata]